MENTETDNRNPRAEKGKNRKVQIEIVRHRDLLTILRDSRLTWKAILSLFLVLVILFFGLTFVTLAIKSIYPYNSISTTRYGATIIKSEDKEVIYWLFNTADLWANSGIEVHKNDVISIRASGKSNNAIHHLILDSKNNRALSYEWTGPEGSVVDNGRNSDRDGLRRRFRIAPHENEGVLLMQVIPEKYQNMGNTSRLRNDFFDKEYPRQFVDGRAPAYSDKVRLDPDIYVVGAGKDEQVIRTDGILHFAVNDVALTSRTIDSMRELMRDSTAKRLLGIGKVHNDGFILLKEKSSSPVVFSQYCGDTNYEDELQLYRDEGFVDAWFVDNVGSFLIVIERKN